MPAIRISRRHATDGLPDLSYGDSGSFALSLTDGDAAISSAVLDDGRAVVLVQNWRTNAARIHAVRADGSGLALDFGAGVRHLMDVLDECGVSAETIITGGFGVTDLGDIRVGFTFFDGDQDRAGALALNTLGHRVTSYGGNGCALHDYPAELMFPYAFAVDRDGDAAMSVWSDLAPSENLLHFAADGSSDARHDGDGSTDDVRLPGGALVGIAQLQYDWAGGLLATEFDGLEYSDILGINGFGVMRFLAADESRAYDAEPDQIDDFTWPSAPKFSVMGLLLTDFGGRDETARIEVSTDGESWTSTIDLEPGDALWLRMRSAGTPSTARTGELYVGSTGNRKTFTVTTRAADPSDPSDPSDPDNGDSGGGPLDPLLISALLAVSLVRRGR